MNSIIKSLTRLKNSNLYKGINKSLDYLSTLDEEFLLQILRDGYQIDPNLILSFNKVQGFNCTNRDFYLKGKLPITTNIEKFLNESYFNSLFLRITSDPMKEFENKHTYLNSEINCNNYDIFYASDAFKCDEVDKIYVMNEKYVLKLQGLIGIKLKSETLEDAILEKNEYTVQNCAIFEGFLSDDTKYITQPNRCLFIPKKLIFVRE